MAKNGVFMRWTASLVLIISLCGCDTGTTLAFGAASLVSFVHTDKTVSDHVVSMVTEEDCSLLHSANNEPYCQDKNPAQTPDEMAREAQQAQTYCYRTLGAITCYREPDAMASAQARVH